MIELAPGARRGGVEPDARAVRVPRDAMR